MSIFRRKGGSSAPETLPAPQDHAPGAVWIGAGARLEGEIVVSDDICIQGRLDGSVESSSNVTVSDSGEVEAQIRSRNVEIHGKVVGNIEATGLAKLGPTASLTGTIHASGVDVQPGAVFEGTIRLHGRRSGGKDAE